MQASTSCYIVGSSATKPEYPHLVCLMKRVAKPAKEQRKIFTQQPFSTFFLDPLFFVKISNYKKENFDI